MYFGILSERVKAVDGNMPEAVRVYCCLLYTSDAADD